MKNNTKDKNSILKFINTNFSYDKSKSSYLSNYKKLILFLEENNFFIDRKDIDYIIEHSSILFKTIDEVKDYIYDMSEIKNEVFTKIMESYHKCKFKEYVCDQNAMNCSEQNDKSIDLVKQYYLEIDEYPLLTYEEEKELFTRFKNGDENARQKLIESNLKLVIFVQNNFVEKDFHLKI